MNLQLALVILGIVLIALIYLVSRHFDKRGRVSIIGTSHSDDSYDQDFDGNNDSVYENAPVLDGEPHTFEADSSTFDDDTSQDDSLNEAQTSDDNLVEPQFEPVFEYALETDTRSELLLSEGLDEVQAGQHRIETSDNNSFSTNQEADPGGNLEISATDSGIETAEPSIKGQSRVVEKADHELDAGLVDDIDSSADDDGIEVLEHQVNDLDDIPELEMSDAVIDQSAIMDSIMDSNDGAGAVLSDGFQPVEEDIQDNISSTQEADLVEPGWKIEAVTETEDDDPVSDIVDEHDEVIDWGSIVSKNPEQSRAGSDEEMKVRDGLELDLSSESPGEEEIDSATLTSSGRGDSNDSDIDDEHFHNVHHVIVGIEENPDSDEKSALMNTSDNSSPKDRIEPVFNLSNDPEDTEEEIMEELLIQPDIEESAAVATQVDDPPENLNISEAVNENSDSNLQSDNPSATEQDGQVAGMNSNHLQTVNYIYPDIEGFEKVSQIDYWVKIAGDRDVGRESVLAQYREAASRIGKPSRIYGMRLPDKGWCDLEMESEETRFADIVVTVQLADSRGPITESEMNMFTRLVSNLSEGTGRGFTFMAPVESALMQAQAIADFTRYYESIFVVNVRPQHSEYLEGASILRCATQLGLDQDSGQFFVRNKSVGKKKVCLYSLANMSDTGKFDFETIKDLRTKGVTFFTKPAVNRSPGAVFAEMVDTAKAFAARIKGEASAPNFDDFSQDDIDSIRVTIEKVSSEMEDLGMAPGSEEAMRVF